MRKNIASAFIPLTLGNAYLRIRPWVQPWFLPNSWIINPALIFRHTCILSTSMVASRGSEVNGLRFVRDIDRMDFQPCLILQAYLHLVYEFGCLMHWFTGSDVNMSKFVRGKHVGSKGTSKVECIMYYAYLTNVWPQDPAAMMPVPQTGAPNAGARLLTTLKKATAHHRRDEKPKDTVWQLMCGT
jgi:hypothetical protein